MTVFRERHIQTRFTGDLVAVHIFFVGILKRVGKRLSLAVGTGLPQPPWLGASLHHQAAGHDRPCAQPGRPLNRPSLAGELSGDYCQCTLGHSCLSHRIERLSEQELIAARISHACFFVSIIVYINRMHARQRSCRMDVAHPERQFPCVLPSNPQPNVPGFRNSKCFVIHCLPCSGCSSSKINPILTL